MKEELNKIYEQMITEGANLKKDMKVGGKGPTAQGGSAELEGPSKQMGPKGSGPEAVKDVDKAKEAPKEINPGNDVGNAAKPKKRVTEEGKQMAKKSFMELYDQVMIKEVGIEDPSYNDEAGDFPPATGADGEQGAEGMEGEELPGEEMEGDKFSQLADLFSQAAELFRGMSSEGGEGLPPEEGMDDMPPSQDEALGQESVQAPVKEAKSEPEPKEFNANITELQKRKLGGKGVKTSTGKASETGISSKDRTGKMETAPKGTPIGGDNKVGGTGSVAKGKDASFLES